jgi:hypothetical protein
MGNLDYASVELEFRAGEKYHLQVLILVDGVDV